MKRKPCFPKWSLFEGILLDRIFIKEYYGQNTPVTELNLPLGKPETGVKRQLANAYLIAKAPELFEHAINLTNMVSSLQIGGIISSELDVDFQNAKKFIQDMVEQICDIRHIGKCEIDDVTFHVKDMIMSPEDIMKERIIMYFISSHTDMNTNEFTWPILPAPEMGEEFVNSIKSEHAAIAKWISENPEKFERAKKGYCN